MPMKMLILDDPVSDIKNRLGHKNVKGVWFI